MDKIALRMMRCPKCGSKHIDAFDNGYWFLCRDCGYNSPVYADEAEAISAFCKGIIRRDIDSEKSSEDDRCFVPSAVRCEDCKHWIGGGIDEKDNFIPPKCTLQNKPSRHDWFCADGERKEA